VTLHLWDEARDANRWYTHHEYRPVLCGRTVNYQEITRDPGNVTCDVCEKAMTSDDRKTGRAP
jgi:hypothetical protein